MDLKLVKSPDPWLEKQLDPFSFNFLNAKEVAKQMIELMHKEGGIGLSANQVALNAQIFVMRPYLDNNKEAFAIINPEILQVSDDQEIMPEGCLSHPDLFLTVKRPKFVTAKYLDTDAKECIITLQDIDARCFLHEYDHLHGIEFTDRVSKLKLDRAKKKQNKMRKKQNG
jgi:peptide deformylase